jgi:tRNA A-37 threonylcarbamoyl transferase component Bud32
MAERQRGAVCPRCGAARPAESPATAPCPVCKSSLLFIASTEVGSPDGGATPAKAGDLPTLVFRGLLSRAERPDEVGRLGGYRVLEVLGSGGMGVVYRAEDPQLGRAVALKAMLPDLDGALEARKRFFREARTMAALRHPNLVTIYQVGEDNGVLFLAMELLTGESLDARLLRRGCLSVEEAVAIARAVAQGLAAVHEQGLIHRDIKPANIWLESKDEAGRLKDEGSPDSSFILHPSSFHVKVLDFGLARPAGKKTDLTNTGLVVGTPSYMAPEQAAGQRIDARADLFALGCVLYQMCTGRKPFEGPDPIAVLHALATRIPPAPRTLVGTVPHGLSDLTMRLLARSPEKRPTSARAVAAELDALAGKAAQPAGTSLRLRRVGIAVLTSVILLAVGFVVVSEIWKLFAPPSVPMGRNSSPRIANQDATVRRAAEWALNLGGTVTPAGQAEPVKIVADLPADSFRLARIDLWDARPKLPPGDGDIGELDGLAELDELRLWAPDLSDLGLERLSRQPFAAKLTLLELHGKEITDAGLAHLVRFPAVATLTVRQCPKLTGTELARLLELKKLERLNLSWNSIPPARLAPLAAGKLMMLDLGVNTLLDDEGAAVLAKLTTLRDLRVVFTPIGDMGAKHLEGLAELQRLDLSFSKLTDDGLRSVGQIKSLQRLSLGGLAITDTGLTHLERLSALESVYFTKKAQVTPEGIARLRAAVPACHVEFIRD